MSDFTALYLERLAAWGAASLLWQGCVIALSWMMWSRRLERSSTATRHRLACAHFAALIAAPLLTVTLLQGSVTVQTHAGEGPLARASMHAGLGASYDAAVALMPAIVAVWACGAIAMLVLLFVEWRRARALECRPVPAALAQRVQRLARELGLTRPPAVAQADVAAPCVLGLRAPVLLTPRRLEALLPPRELDAVLRHELAHVARRDYGWNLLQRALLALLWPHPAAWALYAAVKREREMRCDAIAARGGAGDLAHGLLRLAEARAAPALAQGSGGADLAARLTRLATPTSSRQPGARLSLAALALSGLALAVGAASGASALDPALPGAYVASAFGPVIRFDARDREGSFQLSIRQGRVIGAALERRPVPATHILQSGRAVTVLGPSGRTAVLVTVDPRGAILWAPRA